MWSELETAVRERIPVVVIVLNNGLLGMQCHGETISFGRTTTAIRFHEGDHAAIARAVGAQGASIKDPQKIRPALTAALESPVPTLLDVFVDAKSYAAVRVWDAHEETIKTCA